MTVGPVSVGGRAQRPDPSRATRWYEATVERPSRARYLPLVPNDRRTTVGTGTRRADPLLVESPRETVDLSSPPLAFPTGETARIRSSAPEFPSIDAARVPQTTVAGDPLPTPDGRDGHATAGAGQTTAGAGQTTADEPATRRTRRSDAADPAPVEALLDRVGAGERAREDGRITVERWAAPDDAPVYVLADFERRGGRLHPRGEATVGIGRFEDRLAAERDRLARWRRRGAVGAVLAVAGAAGLWVVSTGGI